jgi:hypothetical protein
MTRFGMTIVLFFGVMQQAQAQAGVAIDDGSAEAEEWKAEEAMSSEASAESSSVLDAGRTEWMRVLKEEVLPNLPTEDANRLRRSVQQRGSLRDDWSRTAHEFLIANAAVAELVIYDWSQRGNQRLNQKLLETLLAFPQFRYPEAALLFAEVFGQRSELHQMSVALVEKALKQEPRLAQRFFELTQTAWGQNLSRSDFLLLWSRACAVLPSLDSRAKAQILQQTSAAYTFWEKALSLEVQSCLGAL